MIQPHSLRTKDHINLALRSAISLAGGQQPRHASAGRMVRAWRLDSGENRLHVPAPGVSESEADNHVCRRLAGTIACVASTTKGGKRMATRTGSAVWEGTLKQG